MEHCQYWISLSQSLDLSVIEAVWNHLDRGCNKRPPTSKEELWSLLKDMTRTLPERVQAVLKNKGNHTKYWLLLELYQLCFSLVYHISNYVIAALIFHFPDNIKKRRAAQDFCTVPYPHIWISFVCFKWHKPKPGLCDLWCFPYICLQAENFPWQKLCFCEEAWGSPQTKNKSPEVHNMWSQYWSAQLDSLAWLHFCNPCLFHSLTPRLWCIFVQGEVTERPS